MALNVEFLNQLESGSIKPNIVLVFTPRDDTGSIEVQHFSRLPDLRPNTNPAFNGAGSLIFWKHEPDSFSNRVPVETIFANHLGKRVGDEVPLSCVDNVSIAGSEIDLRDASVSDDEVSVKLLLDEPGHKSLFQDLIGYTVEIYLGFSGAAFDFENYERFYIGRLKGVNSGSSLSLDLKVGTVVDYWNSTWVHSRRIGDNRLLYKYPLGKPNDKADDPTRRLVSFSEFRKVNHLPFYFRFALARVQGPVEARPWLSIFSNRSPSYLGRQISHIGANSRNFDGINLPRFNIGNFFEKTSLFFFADTDFNFDRARELTRLRFMVGDTKVEVNAIYSFAMFPFFLSRTQPQTTNLNTLLYQKRHLGSEPIYDPDTPINERVALDASLNMLLFSFEALDLNNPRETMSTSISEQNEIFEILVGTPLNGIQPHLFLNSRRRSTSYPVGLYYDWSRSSKDSDSDVKRFYDAPDIYNLNSQSVILGTGIPQIRCATGIKFFASRPVREDDAPTNLPPKDLEFDEGTVVKFFDLETGLGKLDYILINTLNKNLGVSLQDIDQSSFRVSREQYENTVGTTLQSDFSNDGSVGGKELVESKILLSNNMRVINEGGVLKCLYINLTDKSTLQDDNGNPFLFHEDDLLENVTYSTREQDLIQKVKVNLAFKSLDGGDPLRSFYCIDQRSYDRTSGDIVIQSSQDFEGNPEEFDEIDLFANYTEDSQETNLYEQEFGYLFSNENKERAARLMDANPKRNIADLIDTVRRFSTDYFNLNNPSLKMTLVTSHKGLRVGVGDIVVVRDHQAFELFGSQFVKVLIIGKSVIDWGTSAVQVTLDCLFLSTTDDYLSVTKNITAPRNLRLVSKLDDPDRPRTHTAVSLAWDEPIEWAVDDDNLKTYNFKNLTPTGPHTVANLPLTGSKSDASPLGRYNYQTRSIRFFLENGQTFHFGVSADNTVRESPLSNVLTVETNPLVRVPGAPLNLQAVISSENPMQIDLTWQEPTDFGGDVNIRYDVFLNDEFLADAGGSTNYSYLVQGDGQFCFKVRAVNVAGDGPFSNTRCVTILPPPPVPEGSIDLDAIENGTTRIRLEFDVTLNVGTNNARLEINRDGVLIETIDYTGNTSYNYTDTGLDPDTRYCYKIIAVNDSGAGVESNDACETTQEDLRAPGSIRNLRARDITTTSFTLEWDEPFELGNQELTGYNVGSSSDNITFTTVQQTTRSKDFTGLRAGTAYFYKVSAYNATGTGPDSLLEVNTLGVSEVPDQPVLEVEQTEVDSPYEVSVYLNLPNLNSDLITSYVIERSASFASGYSAIQTNNSPQMTNLYRDTTGLVSGTTYYYRARTTNSVGNSIYSEPVSVVITDCAERDAVVSNINVRFNQATAQQKNEGTWVLFNRQTNVDGEGTNDPCGPYRPRPPQSPSHVRNLRLVEARDTEADIAWQIPSFTGGFPIAKYQIAMTGRTFVETTSTNFTIENLTASTDYRVRVRGVNTYGTPGPYAELAFRTAATPVTPQDIGQPTDLIISQSHSSIDKTFSWNAPSELGEPPLTGYKLEIGGSIHETSSTSLRVNGLLYNTNYVATVRGTNSQGDGPKSVALNFMTGEGVPSPPRNISLSIVDNTSVKVDWQAPSVPRGTITGYTIYYRELLSGQSWTQVNVDNVLTNTIQNFERGKTYEFDMTASTSAGASVLTNSPVSISIPEETLPGPIGVTCRIDGQRFLLDLSPPQGANLDLYQASVLVPGQTTPIVINIQGTRFTGIDITTSLTTLARSRFSLSRLPDGDYLCEVSARSPAGRTPITDASRCTFSYVRDRAKPVTNIRFSKSNNRLIVTYDEPVDTGSYTFRLDLRVTNNRLGNTFLNRKSRLDDGYLVSRQINPSRKDQTFTIRLNQDQFDEIFDDKTIVATFRAIKRFAFDSVATTIKTQVYVDVLRKAKPPFLAAARIWSNNIPYVIFNYPRGSEPITEFRVYEVANGLSRVAQTIPNNYGPDSGQISIFVGTRQYTTPGTYTFFMTSVNGAGESLPSVQRHVVVEQDDPEPPENVPIAPRAISANKSGSRFVVNWRRGLSFSSYTFNQVKIYGGTSSNSLSLISTQSIDDPEDRSRISTFITDTYSTRPAGSVYYFAIRVSNSRGDSPQSNVISYRVPGTPTPPQTVPNAPSVRSVSRNTNNTGQIIFDAPSTGPNFTQFKIYELVSGSPVLRRTISANPYSRGQTSISTLIHATRVYTTPGTYTFLMRASNSSGDSVNSNQVSFTVPTTPPPPVNPMPHFRYTRAEAEVPGFIMHLSRTSRAFPSGFVAGDARFFVSYVRNARTDLITHRNFFPMGSVSSGTPTGAAFNFDGKISLSSSSTRLIVTQDADQVLNLFRFPNVFNFQVGIAYRVSSTSGGSANDVFFATGATFDPAVDVVPTQNLNTASFDPATVFSAVPTAVTDLVGRFPRGQDGVVTFTAGTNALGWRLDIFDRLDRNVTDRILNTASEKFKYNAFANLTGSQTLSFRIKSDVDILDSGFLATGSYKIRLTAFNLRGQTVGSTVNTTRVI